MYIIIQHNTVIYVALTNVSLTKTTCKAEQYGKYFNKNIN